MKSTWQCGAALCVVLVGACAGVAPPQPHGAPAFELAGRIVVRYQDRGFSSAVRWKQTQDRDEIWLTAPLGQTIAFLEADAGGATFTGADQRQFRAGSIESLTKSALGWRFPVAGMRFWVLGQPAAAMPLAAIERDEAGRILNFRQDEWRVAFSYGNAGTQPTRLDVVGSDAEIRFVIDQRTPLQP